MIKVYSIWWGTFEREKVGVSFWVLEPPHMDMVKYSGMFFTV